MIDPEIQQQFSDVRTDMEKMRAEVRVTKHDVANVQMVLNGFSTRFDKFEEKISSKIDRLDDKLSIVNTQQQKGLAFFAGAAAIVTLFGAMLAAIGKLIFGAHGG